MRSLALILLFIGGLLSSNAFGEVINKISFKGLTKTKEVYLKGIIESKEGEEFNPETLIEDVQTIKNLNLFFKVESSHEWNEVAAGWDINFTIEEAKYLYPIFSVSGFKTQFKLEAGFNQINFRGKGESIGFVYKWYDRHSFSGFYNSPRHKNGKTGHDLALTKYSTVEPLYFQDTVAAFNFDNYNISVGGHYWLTRRLKVGLGGMYMYEKYEQLDTGTYDLGGSEFFFHKWQVRTFLDYNAIDRHFEFMDGIRNLSYLETIQTVGYPNNSFLKFTNDFYFYKTLGKRSTLGIHNRIGLATNNNSPFSPFVLDGFINVRGVGNRVARGTAELVVNAEYRYSVWRHKWFILQLAGFTDFGTLRQPGASLVDMFNYKEMKLFVGGGLRIHSRVLYNTSFRVDYSVNPIDASQHGLTFGVGQFF